MFRRFFFTYSQPGPNFFINLFVQYSQSDLPPLRPLCGEARAEIRTRDGRIYCSGRFYPCLGVSTNQIYNLNFLFTHSYFHIFMFTYFHIFMFTYFHIFMFSYFHVYMFRNKNLNPFGSILLFIHYSTLHRRRIKTEETLKGRRRFWGTEFIHCLATQLFCTMTILKNRMNSSFLQIIHGAIYPIIHFILVHLSFCYVMQVIRYCFV